MPKNLASGQRELPKTTVLGDTAFELLVRFDPGESNETQNRVHIARRPVVNNSEAMPVRPPI